MFPKFGPAGNSEIFYEQGFKFSFEAPEWLDSMGLDAYEYPCSRGVNIKKDTAEKLGTNAEKYGIALSIHSPYYINLANFDDAMIEKSINYIVESAVAARWMGAKRIVLHPGSCSNVDRSVALNRAIDSLKKAITKLHDMKYDDITICPETMGKRNQLGTVDEIIELCKLNENIIPTLDFGHINALGAGCLKEKEDYRHIFDSIRNSLGEYRFKNLHCHFSRIEYTKNGEKKHWTLSDTQYGPNFEPLADIIAELNITPTIICESRGTMAQDAVKLKTIYKSFL